MKNSRVRQIERTAKITQLGISITRAQLVICLTSKLIFCRNTNIPHLGEQNMVNKQMKRKHSKIYHINTKLCSRNKLSNCLALTLLTESLFVKCYTKKNKVKTGVLEKWLMLMHSFTAKWQLYFLVTNVCLGFKGCFSHFVHVGKLAACGWEESEVEGNLLFTVYQSFS